jgi:hypothetical protein
MLEALVPFAGFHYTGRRDAERRCLPRDLP